MVEERKTRRVFETVGIRRFEEVHQDFENEKGGEAEPSKNSDEFFSSSGFENPSEIQKIYNPESQT
jgi:hypothetical protein